MINPAVETDLVGDVVELTRRDFDKQNYGAYYTRIARGRCRAVTSKANGDLVLWIEIVDEKDRTVTMLMNSGIAIGDVVAVVADASGDRSIRLVRGETP